MVATRYAVRAESAERPVPRERRVLHLRCIMNPTRSRWLSLAHWTTGFVALAASGGLILAATPSVTKVRASQRAGTKQVDIDYYLAGPGSSPLAVSMQVSADGGAIWASAANTFLSGMALIPGGEFTMGDTFNEGSSDERPTHTVDVSAFYMDRTEVTLALWREVRDWGIAAGYTFDHEGLGKGLTHPVHTVSWYDAVKWCNARSRKENRTPAYYSDAGLTQEYKTGQAAPYVSWNTGYRLPTEAEWEKAARGGFRSARKPAR
jgi:formylglycine-generating enzyme required for sulfatase activity